MPTKKQIVDDIILQLTQAAPSDDLELPYSQVAYWLSVHLNQVVATEINGKTERGEMIPAVYKRKAVCELQEEDNTIGDDRVFAELEDDILTLNNDAGIIVVEDEEGGEIYKVSTENLSLFKKLRFSKPSMENLQYIHEGSKIYLPALKPVDVPFESITVWYVPKQDILTAEDDDEVLISDLSLPIVIDLCVNRGLAELYGTQQDTDNDGTDIKKPTYHQSISQRDSNQQ